MINHSLLKKNLFNLSTLVFACFPSLIVSDLSTPNPIKLSAFIFGKANLSSDAPHISQQL